LFFLFVLLKATSLCGRKITENLADIEIYFLLFSFLSPKSCNFAQKFASRG